MRLHDVEAARFALHLDARQATVANGLLDEEHPSIARPSRHQVLRALKHEAPAEMRPADEIRSHVGRKARAGPPTPRRQDAEGAVNAHSTPRSAASFEAELRWRNAFNDRCRRAHRLTCFDLHRRWTSAPTGRVQMACSDPSGRVGPLRPDPQILAGHCGTPGGVLPREISAKLVLRHAVAKRVAADSKQPRGRRLIAAGTVQRLHNQRLFDVVQDDA